MGNRYIVMLDSSTQDEQNIITNHLKSLSLGYWHWFRDSWLVTDPSYRHNVDTIRNIAQQCLPGKTMLVIQVESGVSWSGFGDPVKFEWLKSVWNQ